MEVFGTIFRETWFLSVGWLAVVLLVPGRFVSGSRSLPGVVVSGLLALVGITVAFVLTGYAYFYPTMENEALSMSLLALMSGGWVVPGIAAIKVVIVTLRSKPS